MEDFRILDPDPYNNSTGSASLVQSQPFSLPCLLKKADWNIYYHNLMPEKAVQIIYVFQLSNVFLKTFFVVLTFYVF